jgi:hypothetical protein
MIRAVLMLAAFSLISPSIREFFIDGFGILQKQVTAHSIVAMASCGVLGFSSFLAIRLGSHR